MSWHWLFLVNLIPGILVALGAWCLIDFNRLNWKLFDRFDWWGLVALAAFLGGLEDMLCIVPINKLALGTLPPDKIKGTSGLYNLTRNLGGVLGLAVFNTLLTDRSTLHYQCM